MTPDNQAQRTGFDRSILGYEGAVGLENARRVRSNGAAIQQVPQFAIGIDRPSADNPGVTEIKAAFAGPVDMSAGLGE